MSVIGDLSSLIFGLSKREKNEFEQYAKLQGGDQRYMQVYRLLDKMIAPAKSLSQVPDEEMLLKRVRLELKGGNVTAYCGYLFRMILRSLRSTQELSRKEDEILQDFNNARILARRGLFQPAIDTLESALESAMQYEYFWLADQVLRELVYLEGQKDSRSYADRIHERLDQLIRISKLQAREVEYFSLHHRTFLFTRNRRLVAPEAAEIELQALKNLPALAEAPDDQSFFSQVYFWQSRASIAYAEGNIEHAAAYSREIVSLWQSERCKPLQQEHPRKYIIHLHNLAIYLIGIGQFGEAEQWLDILEQFPCASFDDAAEKFQNVLFSRQLLYLFMARYQDAVDEVTGKLKEIEGEYRSKINTARLISLYFNTLSACFLMKDYPSAQVWSDRIFQIGKSEQRRDIQFINKVFQIIIRYELGQLHYLDQEVKNTGQNLRDHGQLDQVNGLILQWLGKLIRNALDPLPSARDKKAQEKAILEGFREELRAVKANNPSQHFIGLEEILIWLDGKIEAGE